MVEADQYLTKAEVAKLLHRSKRYVEYLVSKGELPVIRESGQNGRCMFSLRQIAAYQDQQRRAAEREAEKKRAASSRN